MLRAIRVLAVLAAVIVTPSALGQINLYDGSLPSTPDAQPWLSYGAIPPIAYYATGGGYTQLNTTGANSIFAGFHNYDNLSLTAHKNPAFPTLDRTAGFTVTIDSRIVSESHASNDRAGFSVIALASDLKGIELAFWTNQIWAQSGPNTGAPGEALFTHAEGIAHNTATVGFQHYALTIQGNGYALTADGVPILSGLVRDYTSWVPPPGAPDPYEKPSFVFVGDNTSSASAAAEFSLITVPEPGAISLLIVVTLAALTRRR